jgi:hypothetical protein
MTYLTLIERRQQAVPRVGRRLLAAVPLPPPLRNPSCTREALRLGAAPRQSEWFPNRRQCGGGAMAFFFQCSGSVGGEEVGRVSTRLPKQRVNRSMASAYMTSTAPTKSVKILLKFRCIYFNKELTFLAGQRKFKKHL